MGHAPTELLTGHRRRSLQWAAGLKPDRVILHPAQFLPLSYLQTKHIYHLAAWGGRWRRSNFAHTKHFCLNEKVPLRNPGSFSESIKLFSAGTTSWPQEYSGGKTYPLGWTHLNERREKRVLTLWPGWKMAALVQGGGWTGGWQPTPAWPCAHCTSWAPGTGGLLQRG